MKNTKSIVRITNTATIAILFSLAMVVTTTITTTTTTITAASAQQSADRIFESEDDGFRLQIPQGWVIEDHDNITYEGYSEEDIALLCPANEALPGIGGEYNCLAANTTDFINIIRVPDLQAVPEFQDLTTPISTNDLVALAIQSLQNGNKTSDIQIQNSTDLDEFRKIVNMTMTRYDDAGTPFNPSDDFRYNMKSLAMFVLSEDRNTGYQIFNTMATPNIWNRTEHSPAVQEVYNSFELVT
jgi:hypothetical protein